MEDPRSQETYSETRLIEALRDSFCEAVEELDAQTIVKCIQSALQVDAEHYTKQAETYTTILQAVSKN
jgi:hypothetical protein